MISKSDDETNFLHNLLLTNRHVAYLRKPCPNKSSVNIKLSKFQLFKMMQPGWFLSKHISPIIENWIAFMKNAVKPKSVLIPLGLTAAATVDDGIHKTNPRL